jgi:transcription initiation factor TFIID TATA-box-binding protein
MATPRTITHFSPPKYIKVTLKPTYEVVNIVASAELGIELDLYGLAKISRDVDYEPEQFPGAIFKVLDPKAALLLFNSGKIICTGAKTTAEVERAVDHAVQLVKKYLNVYKGGKRASYTD